MSRVEVFSHPADYDLKEWESEPGWYYWYVQPGCLPDSDPIGPFDSRALAIADAREDASDDPNGDEQLEIA